MTVVELPNLLHEFEIRIHHLPSLIPNTDLTFHSEAQNVYGRLRLFLQEKLGSRISDEDKVLKCEMVLSQEMSKVGSHFEG